MATAPRLMLALIPLLTWIAFAAIESTNRADGDRPRPDPVVPDEELTEFEAAIRDSLREGQDAATVYGQARALADWIESADPTHTVGDALEIWSEINLMASNEAFDDLVEAEAVKRGLEEDDTLGSRRGEARGLFMSIAAGAEAAA